MFVFRRIKESDTRFKLITGNDAFNELSSNLGIENYIDQDILKGGAYFTYLLFRNSTENSTTLLGLLRYKIISISEFKQELKAQKITENELQSYLKWFYGRDYSIIYLSRIGISENFQSKNLSLVIYNFFEFLIKEKYDNVIIYVKILKNLMKVIGPSYNVVKESYDENWGDFYLAMKIIKSELN